MLLIVRDILAVTSLCFSVLILTFNFKYRKETQELHTALSEAREAIEKLEVKCDFYENQYIPELKTALEDSENEVTRLAASKAERDIDYLIKGLEYIISQKTP